MTSIDRLVGTVRKRLLRYAPAHDDGRVTNEADLDALVALDELAALARTSQEAALLYRRDWEAAEARVSELQEVLRKYGRHGTFCAHSTGGLCDCGLDAALAADRTEQRVPTQTNEQAIEARYRADRTEEGEA